MLYFRKTLLFIALALCLITFSGIFVPTPVYADDAVTEEKCQDIGGTVSSDGTKCLLGVGTPLQTTLDIWGANSTPDVASALTEAECRNIGGVVTMNGTVCQLNGGSGLQATRPIKEDAAAPTKELQAYQETIVKIADTLCPPGPVSRAEERAKECAPIKQGVEKCETHIRGLVQEGGGQTITENTGLMGCLEKELEFKGLDRNALKLALADMTITAQSQEPASMACMVEGVGWIVCPTMLFLARSLDGAFSFISSEFLQMEQSMLQGAQKYWTFFLNIANALFILVFLLVIFSQISGIGIDNYGIKKILPKLIIAAVLMNLSFYICQLLVDLSNAVGFAIKDTFDTNIAEETILTGGTSNVTDAQTSAVLILGAAGGAIAIYLALPVLGGAIVAGLVAVLSVVLILIARKVIILLLVVISPIAFLALVLPNTEKLFQKWKSLMTSMLLLFPIIGLLFGGSRATATILQSSTSTPQAVQDPVEQIASIVILTIPFFATYPLLKGALNATGKLGAAINGFSDKARGAAKGWGDESTIGGWGKRAKQNRMERRAAVKAGTYDSRWGKASPRNLLSRMNRGLNDNSLYNKATGGYGADQQLAAQALNRKAMKEVNEMVNGDDDVALAFLQSNGSTNSNQFRNLDETQQKQFRRMSDAGYHKKSTTFLALAEYLGENGKGNAEDILNGLTKAQDLGADSVDVKSVYDNAIVNYRKSGRGDVMGELQALQTANATTVDANGIKTIRGTGNGVPIGDTAVKLEGDSDTVKQAQKAAWRSIDPSGIHRDAFSTQQGTNSYQAHLNSDIGLTQSALAGFDRMEVRAQNNARTSIVQAAQHHTGNTSIDTVEKAKAALLAQYGGARPTPQTPPSPPPQQGGGNSPGNPPGGSPSGTQPPQNLGPAAPSPGGSPTSPFTNPPAKTQNWTQGSNGFYMPPGNNRRNSPPPPPPPPLGGP